MKKLMIHFMLMIIYSAAVTAYAEDAMYSIDEIRNQINMSWQSEYETKWGRINVDIHPTIPNVRTMPVLMVQPAFWVPTTEMDVEWTAQAVHPTSDTFRVIAGDIFGEEASAIKGKAYESISTFIYAPINRDEKYAPMNDLTINDMLEKLQSILDTVDHSHFDIDADQMLYVRVSSLISKKTGDTLLPAAITITLPTTLRSIPIYDHVINSISSHRENELTYWPHLTLMMRTPTSYKLLGVTVKEVKEIAADIPLCSFSVVREAIEQEIEEGHIRAVYSVDLGYALYNVSGTRKTSGESWKRTAEFYAFPTWRCVCIYTNQSTKTLPAEAFENPATSKYYKTLYFNAQTGVLIDPNDGKRGCGDFPGIISWDDVD